MILILPLPGKNKDKPIVACSQLVACRLFAVSEEMSRSDKGDTYILCIGKI